MCYVCSKKSNVEDNTTFSFYLLKWEKLRHERSNFTWLPISNVNTHKKKNEIKRKDSFQKSHNNTQLRVIWVWCGAAVNRYKTRTILFIRFLINGIFKFSLYFFLRKRSLLFKLIFWALWVTKIINNLCMFLHNRSSQRFSFFRFVWKVTLSSFFWHIKTFRSLFIFIEKNFYSKIPKYKINSWIDCFVIYIFQIVCKLNWVQDEPSWDKSSKWTKCQEEQNRQWK